MVSNETVKEIFNTNFGFGRMSVGIEHNLRKIFLSDNLWDTEKNVISFRIEDGLPLAIIAENFLFFQIRCIHDVTKRIKIPIESGCEWSIINGVSDGAFKYKGGLDVKYLDIFHDNNCAIYYPPRLEFDKPVKTKKIKLHLEIYPVIYGGLKKRITTVDFTGSDGVKNSIMINPEVKRSYLLNISLRRGIGFRNRNSYDAKLESKQILNDKDYDYDCDNDDKEISSELPVQQEQSCALYSSIPISDENGACIVCSIKAERCIECDLKFVPKFWPHMQSEWFKINLNDNRFFTSEYVSLNNLMYEVVKPREDSTNSDVPVAYFEIQKRLIHLLSFVYPIVPFLKYLTPFGAPLAVHFLVEELVVL